MWWNIIMMTDILISISVEEPRRSYIDVLSHAPFSNQLQPLPGACFCYIIQISCAQRNKMW